MALDVARFREGQPSIGYGVQEQENVTNYGNRPLGSFEISAFECSPAYRFDLVELRKGCYPRSHGEIEDELAEILKGFVALLKDEKVLPMEMTGFPVDSVWFARCAAEITAGGPTWEAPRLSW